MKRRHRNGQRRRASREDLIRWANRLLARQSWNWHQEDWEWM